MCNGNDILLSLFCVIVSVSAWGNLSELIGLLYHKNLVSLHSVISITNCFRRTLKVFWLCFFFRYDLQGKHTRRLKRYSMCGFGVSKKEFISFPSVEPYAWGYLAAVAGTALNSLAHWRYRRTWKIYCTVPFVDFEYLLPGWGVILGGVAVCK